MAKKIIGQIKLHIPAGNAKPSPPVGPALGQRGLNIMEFCKAFNAATQNHEQGVPIPVLITAFSDRSFRFETKTPPATFFLKRAAGIKGGSADCRVRKMGKVTVSQVREIAEYKMPDLNCYDFDTAEGIIRGSARSIGLDVVED